MCETMDDYYLHLQHCHIDCSLDVLQVVLDFSPLRRAQEILRSAAVNSEKHTENIVILVLLKISKYVCKNYNNENNKLIKSNGKKREVQK